jgi:hypothetical protein
MKKKNGFLAQPICMWSSAKTWEDKNPSFKTQTDSTNNPNLFFHGL